MVTEKEGINHDTAGTDWMVPNNKRLFYSTAFPGKPDLFHIAIKMLSINNVFTKFLTLRIHHISLIHLSISPLSRTRITEPDMKRIFYEDPRKRASLPLSDFSFKSSTESVRNYLIGICLIINLIILAVFLGFYLRTDALFNQQLINTGRVFFEEIVITRKWLAQHQGIFVTMKPGDTVNPYLKKIPGLKTIIHDSDGESYMLKNPALATREISLIADREGTFKFHMTSLNPINPDNRADLFEKNALESFATGEHERYALEKGSAGRIFRYMAPVLTEESCLRCHAHQGYSVGDIRGGISVTIPAQSMMEKIQANKFYLTLSVLGVVVIITLFMTFIARFFIRDLGEAEQKLLDMATTDYLTGLLNRREGFRRIIAEFSRAGRAGKPLCAMMLDIDHFKHINDTHGHLTGDSVLKSLAATLKNALRGSDILCRYGGEEFLIVLPETGIEETTLLAERLRQQIEQSVLHTQDRKKLNVTISIGVVGHQAEESYEHLIARADQALYKAKESGRNRVCTG